MNLSILIAVLFLLQVASGCNGPKPPTGRKLAPSKSSKCGTDNYNNWHYQKRKKRVSGGGTTIPYFYPWMVRLPMGCGGALISDRHILTAKHCLCWKGHWSNDDDDCQRRQPPICDCKINGQWKLTAAEATNHLKGKKVKVGVHNQDNSNYYQEVLIREVKWPNNPEDHDFAMVILDQPVNLNNRKIGTVCLPSSSKEDYRGEKAQAMGWGMTSVGSPQSPKLKDVFLTVSNRPYHTNWLYTEVKIINGVPQDPCAGDSGGPLVHKDQVSGRWTIIGTVYGAGYNCRDGKTNGKGKWNKVTAHLDWIKKQLR